MFKNIFSRDKKENSCTNRFALVDEKQLDDIVQLSMEKPVLIFKHSTRCGISGMILNRFEKKIKDLDSDFYIVDVLKNRDISNLIADRFKIPHQSPQLLYVKSGKIESYGSHSGVLDVDLKL